MRKYILNANTALILNEEVYALVRESKVSKNNVCALCYLNDICIDAEKNHKLSELCMTEFGDERWFFVRAQHLTKFQREGLERTISADINDL